MSDKIDILVISDQEQIAGRFRFLTDYPGVELRVATSLDSGLRALSERSPKLLFFSGGLSGLSADLIARNLESLHNRKGSRRYYLSPGKPQADLGQLVSGVIDANLDELRFAEALNTILKNAVPRVKPGSTPASRASAKKRVAPGPVAATEQQPVREKTRQRSRKAQKAATPRPVAPSRQQAATPAEPASPAATVKPAKPAEPAKPAKPAKKDAKSAKKPAKRQARAKGSPGQTAPERAADQSPSSAMALARAALENARRVLEDDGGADPAAAAFAAAIEAVYSAQPAPAELAAELVCEPPPFSPPGTVIAPDGSVLLPFDALLMNELAKQAEAAAEAAEELEARELEERHAREALELAAAAGEPAAQEQPAPEADRVDELMQLTEPKPEFVFVSESEPSRQAMHALRAWLSTEAARRWLAAVAPRYNGRMATGGVLAIVLVVFVVVYQLVQAPRLKKPNPFAVEPVQAPPAAPAVPAVPAASVPAAPVAAKQSVDQAAARGPNLGFLSSYERVESDKPGWRRYRSGRFEVRVFSVEGRVMAVQAIDHGADSAAALFGAMSAALVPGSAPRFTPSGEVDREVRTSRATVDGIAITSYENSAGRRKGMVFDFSAYTGAPLTFAKEAK